MQYREEQCGLAVVNGSGRCIADCHWVWESGCTEDCVGNKDSEDHHEQEGREVQHRGGRM